MLTQAAKGGDALFDRRVACAQDVEGRDGRESRVAAHAKMMQGGEIFSGLRLLPLLFRKVVCHCGGLVLWRLSIGRLVVAVGVEVDATILFRLVQCFALQGGKGEGLKGLTIEDMSPTR